MLKKKKKKILFVGPFPDPITGNSIANLTAYLGFKKKGYRVDLINSSLSFFDDKVGVFSFKKIIDSFSINFQVYKIPRFDLVYITPGQTIFGVLKYSLIIFVAKLFKKEIVIHIHGNYLRQTINNSSNIKKILIKRILGMSDKGIVLSKSLIPNLFPVLNKNKIHIVYNFVENYLVEGIEPLIELKLIEEIKIIFLSNLMKEKGILDLLKALKILKEENINYKAKIAGNIDEQLKHEIKYLLEELPEVEYLGVVKGQEKREMLLWGNIFVFPTYYKMEGQPISILEAMATGNIVLTTNYAGIPDIFSEKNGLFINKQNQEDIVEKIKIVFKNKLLYNRMIKSNYKYATSNFSSDKYISNIEKVFNQY